MLQKPKVTIRVQFRPLPADPRSGTLVYRVGMGSCSASVCSDIRLSSVYWDADTSSIVPERCPTASGRSLLQCYAHRLRQNLQRLGYIVAALAGEGRAFSPQDVCRRYRKQAETPYLLQYVEQRAAARHEARHYSTAEKYRTAARRLAAFLGQPDLPLSALTPALLRRFEQTLWDEGVSPNTSSAYLRSLAACYNAAVEELGLDSPSPFHTVFTGVARTRKRAITAPDLRRIAAADLTHCPRMALARDIFLFSFLMRGMSLVDILFLRKADFSGQVLSYTRRKTGQRIDVGIEPCMRDIVARHAAECAGSPYLFPVLRHPDFEHAYREYRHYLSAYNYQLHRLGQRLGIAAPLTGYVARHTWATLARDKGIPTNIISAALGHHSERTTLIYLSTIDNGVIDAANRSLLADLLVATAASPQPAAPVLPHNVRKKHPAAKVHLPVER